MFLFDVVTYTGTRWAALYGSVLDSHSGRKRAILSLIKRPYRRSVSSESVRGSRPGQGSQWDRLAAGALVCRLTVVVYTERHFLEETVPE